MGLVKLADLEPGMTLTADVRNHDGRFLLSSGTILAEKHIRIFKAWGIIEAEADGIRSEKISRAEHCGPGDLEFIRASADDFFFRNDLQHPVIKELKKIHIERKIARTNRKAKKIVSDSHPAMKCPCEVRREDAALRSENSNFIEDDVRLPTLPEIFSKINEIIANPKSSALEIADVISKDTALAARLLTIVNSAFYGFPVKIDTISRAVVIVGTKQLTTLAYGVTIMKMFQHISADYIDTESFWKHSLACGIASRVIAGYKDIRNTERLFVAGLLHDIGRLALYSYRPSHMIRAIKKAKEKSLFLHETELEELGIDHCEAGGMLAKKWRLPSMLEDTMQFHHFPVKSCNRLESSIVHIANIITNAAEIGSSGEMLMPVLDFASWDLLGLSKNILTPIIEQIDRQIHEIMAFFLPDLRAEQ
ncbi:MAG: HDOD domain-containing protein [Syntrophales bacterium]|jgi:HD-like signal output (HDOD) protein|nr:HDOD domain-containing protein [Syntrophales bacterium]MDY0043370.1 HDOD domain-containing protein [Syntrophales bacterium]